MTETIDAGTQPSLASDPLSALVLRAPQFDFPGGLDPERSSGPLGPRPQDQDPRQPVPILGMPSSIAVPRTFTLLTGTGAPAIPQPVDVVKPTLLLLYSHDLIAADVSVNLMHFPGIANQAYLDDNNGLKWRGLDVFLWAPGRWFLAAITSAGRKLTYLMLETESAQLAGDMRDQAATFVQQASHTVLAAATVTTLVDLPTIVRCRRIVLQNVGANPVFWTYGSATPSATRGYFIPAGGTVVIEGSSLMMAQIRGFSTAGTSVAVQREENPWIL